MKEEAIIYDVDGNCIERYFFSQVPYPVLVTLVIALP